MTRVLVLGAGGRIAQIVVRELLHDESVNLTLYLRNDQRLHDLPDLRATAVEGDVLNGSLLKQAVAGQDIVYANLGGKDIVDQARGVVTALEGARVRRLIWISTLGIYDEVPGEFGRWNHRMLDGGYLETYAAAAKVIESSRLDYTIIRPAWLTDKDEVDYEITQKGEPFKGTEVSRKSIAALVVRLITDGSAARSGDSFGHAA
ncbi:putative NADH-flavin reductase [Mycobacteroides abscessus subsp. abscessus]|uniref:NAD(P)H-binding protein n=1 Tax=Mycobacteroides abscessus TaxID=36809 RepID=UPI00092CE16F|nr:NAD(P)H-binding protein [Mycobacteroides abscessus]SIN16328.1 putative NADH-flavin reductase [Mycobacteroides abscessus subsp. abscessus]SLE81491.1 putative NADH-flavin reductase [Mycobacteroides abscessus subsp. abscessus]